MWSCIGGVISKVFGFINRVDNVNWPPWKFLNLTFRSSAPRFHGLVCTTNFDGRSNTTKKKFWIFSLWVLILFLADFKSTKLLGSAPDNIIKYMTQNDINYNNHHRGLTPEVSRLLYSPPSFFCRNTQKRLLWGLLQN